jgi:glycosyltransferase involved in cell wall biosynthesis
VVDNGSDDKTQEIANSYSNVKVVYEPRMGVGFARQAGFSEAKGEIIASTDADSTVPMNWLSEINRIFNENNHIVGITGPAYPIDAGRLEFFVYPFYKSYLSFFASKGINVCAGYNLAVRKEAFQDIGGFNTSLKIGEDSEFWKRLKKYGQTIFAPYLTVPVSCRRLRSRRGLAGTILRYGTAYVSINLFNIPPTFLR